MATRIGNYTVLKQIGEGGFARTYLARHTILGEMACLKQNIELSDVDVRLLKKEAKLLWHVHHHSLPTLRDFIQLDDGSYVMVMTFVEGKDLQKIVDEDYPEGIDPEHVCWMMQRLLNALHYLHYYGIIHGDVKPANIMIKPEEHNAILVDYGLATLKPRSRTKVEGYTPAFAAPEQVAGKPPIPETDIYGLGVSMIHALGGNYIGMTFPDSIPRKLQDFISQMVRRNPLDRPSSASELIRPLSDLREELFGSRSSGKTLMVS